VCLDESIRLGPQRRHCHLAWSVLDREHQAGRVGGYLEARAVHDFCTSQGVGVWCGGMLETGLGRAANLALASLPASPCRATSQRPDRYLHEDITPPFRLVDGTIAVPTARPRRGGICAPSWMPSQLGSRHSPEPSTERETGSAERWPEADHLSARRLKESSALFTGVGDAERCRRPDAPVGPARRRRR